ncbi:DUF732 domain-containing protein [Mycobacterium shigaense]|uniref:Uncharacterized protein n=1 Tax=Mycobacterium shigaense TaxID=722731 RepID=A0A1Z4EFL1_9MYCO|nr:DUF732 domain-containing protein [Mycobacterium shigaense]MEA1124802.1 DUF732 domain-containing protein [Mycobacterium shigaense]PRI16482.1 hypothetical protein B2J96_06850 [Mycobacterium shigaense]BAX91757.1 hypothetical protein MSG_01603 [Mycobacterium shigaense]
MKLLPALLIPAAIALAAPAQADLDGDDGAFLNRLQKAGIAYNSPAQVVTSAKAVCALLSNGETAIEILKDLKDTNPGMTLDRAAAFTVIAANAYCPEHLVPTPKPAA